MGPICCFSFFFSFSFFLYANLNENTHFKFHYDCWHVDQKLLDSSEYIPAGLLSYSHMYNLKAFLIISILLKTVKFLRFSMKIFRVTKLSCSFSAGIPRLNLFCNMLPLWSLNVIIANQGSLAELQNLSNYYSLFFGERMPKSRDTINSNRKLTSITANKVFFLKKHGRGEKISPSFIKKNLQWYTYKRPQKIIPNNGFSEVKKMNMFKTTWWPLEEEEGHKLPHVKDWRALSSIEGGGILFFKKIL